MVKTLDQFDPHMVEVARGYVAAYEKLSEVREVHLIVMRALDSGDPDQKQLAECIDVILFERGLVQRAEIEQENAEWHDDARYWIH